MEGIPESYRARIEADREKAKGTLYSDSHNVLAINDRGDRCFRARRRNPSYSAGNGFEIKCGLGQYWEVRYGTLGAKKTYIRGFGYVYDFGRLTNYSSVSRDDGGKVDIPKQVRTKNEVMKLLGRLDFKGFGNLKRTNEMIGI
jgi:hypothetical protein